MKAIGGSDVCETCAAHVLVITQDLEPRIAALEAEMAEHNAEYHAGCACQFDADTHEPTITCKRHGDQERRIAQLEAANRELEYRLRGAGIALPAAETPAEHEHNWTESVDGPDVVGKHCTECGVDYDYGEDDL